MTQFGKLLERMEDVILEGASLPLTPYSVVNSDRLLPLLDRVREALPQEVVQAQELLQERDLVLQQAHEQAMHVLRQAEQRANHLVGESALVKAIEDEATKVREQLVHELKTLYHQTQAACQQLREEAEAEAQQLRQQAEGYAQHLLQSVEEQLSQLHSHVQQQRQALPLRHTTLPVPQQQAFQQPTAADNYGWAEPAPVSALQQQPLMTEQAPVHQQIAAAMAMVKPVSKVSKTKAAVSRHAAANQAAGALQR
jgi:vacuolar-type H+-ATPase subunit H